jgi:hypothetical protein
LLFLSFFVIIILRLRQNLGITKGIKASSRGAIVETLPLWGGVSLSKNRKHEFLRELENTNF